ncbi:MAG: hypothetical protein OXL98_15130 [Acidimicrobiaceae bacterium]|nr:hypothetical protein [Acidimicrobiaceae bacterium]
MADRWSAHRSIAPKGADMPKDYCKRTAAEGVGNPARRAMFALPLPSMVSDLGFAGQGREAE